ncbi:MAG: hypothetical protein CMP22_05805 [Rickettsiales bacterium]|nr:hypothetical protein [Rickettsiales bacterium]
MYKLNMEYNLDKITADFKNCYGINSLKHTFDFTNNNTPVVIYAPNGVMKTSFAKTLHDYVSGASPKDIFYPDKVSSFSITESNGHALKKESIFVTTAIDEKYQSEKISTLLASESLKLKYDEIFSSISTKKDELFSILKKQSGITKEIENTFTRDFGMAPKDVLTLLGRLEREVNENANNEYTNIKYKTLFSDRILEFLEKENVEKLIEEYTKAYEKLINQSLYFKKGVFNHTNAETIAKNLKKNGWFEGGHSVSLKNDGIINEISTEEELISAIENEKQKILQDKQLSEMFQTVDKELTTAELRNFRDYLIEHPYIVPALNDITSFKQKIWVAYLVENKDSYLKLIKEYDDSRAEIKNIIEQADNEQTHWGKVLKIFNERFSVPFKVKVENKSDAVLNIAAPQITFYFHGNENDTAIKTDRATLHHGLSNGEKRALFILNIIFELEARKQKNIETLLILDDIADSFDYKNKYAIIQYLSDLRDDNNFKLIILTHNFDFYRTVKGRLNIWGDNKLISNKENGEIQLLKDTLTSNPFDEWKKSLSEPAVLIASIPFARNIAEYIGKNDIYTKLTSLLHIKYDTKDITISDLSDIYSSLFDPKNFESFDHTDKSVYDLILETCENISTYQHENLKLEEKITLSIGIRLQAETCLIQMIQEEISLHNIKKNQTSKLIKIYEKQENKDENILRIMKRVSIMTPENIHLNSFMYEPILDMSGHHLKSLYKDISGCINSSNSTH